MGGLGEDCVERANFLAVLAFLDDLQVFVWVYDPEECSVSEAWRLGAEGTRCLGALRWHSKRGHVQPGCASLPFVELPPATAPWLRSVVGAPKAKGRPKAKAKVKQQRAGVGNRFGSRVAAAPSAEDDAAASASRAEPVSYTHLTLPTNREV